MSASAALSTPGGASRAVRRIVSLLPSATEIICALGLGDRLVGVTHECDWPPFVGGLPKLTSSRIPKDASQRAIDEAVRGELGQGEPLYALDEALLVKLAPDLIVTQALCAVCAVAIEAVEEAACRLPQEARIVNLEPHGLDDVWRTIRLVAEAAGVLERAESLLAALSARIARVERAVASRAATPSVVLLEWLDPPYASGHWTPEIVARAGGRELIGRAGAPSRAVPIEELLAADPDVLVIACCGCDLARSRRDAQGWLAHGPARALTAVREGRVWIVDGNAHFSRPGPRLVDSLEQLAAILHPQLASWPADVPPVLRYGPDGGFHAWPYGT